MIGSVQPPSPGLARALRSLAAAVVVVAASLAAPAAARAQSPSLQTDIASVAEADYPQARLVFNAEDTAGADLAALGVANVAITIDGKPAKVDDVQLASSEKLPLDVLIVMDTSGSMKGERLDQAKAAAREFVSGLSPDDRVAVLRFANSITLSQDFTTDHVAINAAIDGLVASGQTELYKVTAAAAVKAAQSTSSRRAVILLSDGDNDTVVTDVTADAALASAKAAGVPFFTIAVVNAAVNPAYLTQLAATTGGRYLEATRPGDLRGVYASIGRLLRSQYVVTFDASSAAGAAAAQVALTLSVNGRSATASTSFTPGAAFAAPTVSVSGLTAGDALTGPRVLTVTTTGKLPVAKVSYIVDGVNVFDAKAPPYTFTYDPKAYGAGPHTLKVSAQIGSQFIDAPPIAFTSAPPEGSSDNTATSSGGRGGLPLIPIAAAAAALALLGAGGLFVANRRGRPIELALAPDERVTPWATRHRPISAMPPPELAEDNAAPAEDIGEALGVLIARAGSDLGAEYAVGGKPVSIGSGAKCAVRVDDPKLAAEEARLWVRKGHLMVHKMTRLTIIASDGVSGGWTILEPGDTFQAGDHSYEFRLLPESAPIPDGAKPDIPSILRDDSVAPPPPPAPAPLTPAFGPVAGVPAPDTPPSDDAPPLRLTELMPHDMGFSEDDDEAQAS